MYGREDIERLLAIGEEQRIELMGTSPARTSVSETEGEVAATSSPAITQADGPGGCAGP